ncbi:MAG TPA: AcvB/VirJ family lysyl-phosphatidylglycerol hydrolase, partial [Rariglobus sp.]
MRLLTLILAGWLVLLSATRELTAAPVEVERTVEALQLRRGAQSLLWYRPVNATIVGLCLLGSGDGGWSYWEERVAAHLAKKGWAVAGLDFAVYASADYTQHIL